jgi:hypothetical protein
VNVDPSETPVHRRAMAGARARWGPPRIVRLDRLDPDTARLIRALLAQAPQGQANKKAAADQDPATAGVDGGTRDAAPTD